MRLDPPSSEGFEIGSCRVFRACRPSDIPVSFLAHLFMSLALQLFVGDGCGRFLPLQTGHIDLKLPLCTVGSGRRCRIARVAHTTRATHARSSFLSPPTALDSDEILGCVSAL